MRALRLLVSVAAVLLAACPGPRSDDPDSGADCPAGTQGCACASGDTCAKSTAGEQLVCQGGTCEAMSCPAGSTGCVCRRGSACDAPGDACTNGFCVQSACTAGTTNCACLAGTCGLELYCLSGTVCVDSQGHEGGACRDDGRCDTGNLCDGASGRCVHCERGSQRCQCSAAGGCNGGLLCTGGLCVPANQLPPQDARCYTPCRADGLSDAGAKLCTTDDVYEGCADGQSCTHGSCLAPGQSKPSCVGDVDCPFFQVCLQGGCWSNCTANADCPSGQGCFKKACRPTCQAASGSTACAQGYACTAADGQNGHCTAMPRAAATPGELPQGGIHLPVQHLALSNVAPQGRFIVVPNAQIPQTVTVRKLWHQVRYPDGTTERVDAPVDAAGQYRACDPVKNECPLWWLGLGVPGQATTRTPTVSYTLPHTCVDEVAVALDAGTQTVCGKIAIDNAGATTAVQWEGALEISSRDSRVLLTLSYLERPDGQWSGQMFYFGTFETDGLQAWLDTPPDSTPTPGPKNAALQAVKNALLRRWGAMRAGMVEGWSEFAAVLNSTSTGSWAFEEVRAKCRNVTGASTTAVCYPYLNPAGVQVYVQQSNVAPVPTGVSELPFALNLKVSATNPAIFEGRVESERAMHYPGNPAIKLELAADPTVASSCASSGGSDCLIFLKGFGAGGGAGSNELVTGIGGRYLPSGGCATGYAPAAVPWLLTDFVGGTTAVAGGRMRSECRDLELPFNRAADGALGEVNQNLSLGNPVPDGVPRRRTLRFLDGALVNQKQLFLLFEEKFDGFVDGIPQASAYGFIVLERAQAELGPQSYAGVPTSTVTHAPPVPQGATCSPALLAAITNSSNVASLADVLLHGTALSPGFTLAAPSEVHYFCEDLGTFDGVNPNVAPTNPATRAPCSTASNVTYFGYAGDLTQHACNSQTRLIGPADGGYRVGGCMEQLTAWRATQQVDEQLTYRCTDTQLAYCDNDRLDLRAGKTFYQRAASAPLARAFLPLQPLIDSAFRYKTRFRSSTGGQVGFAPALCLPNSDQVPYCYDPRQIEEVRDRVDCLLWIYDDLGRLNASGQRLQIQDFLKQSYSVFTAGPASYDGFERLYSELLVMMGDDALTAAFASRFDLAAAGGANFQGSSFEKNGIDLTGVAGAEMVRLYQAVQYYQLALDRLYSHGPNLATALTDNRGGIGTDGNFISPATVTAYLERLVRAASQKSRAWSEIAKRYQNFNRPDLARAVVARAYVNAYLESSLLSSMMLAIDASSGASARPQIRVVIEKMQLTFRMALVDMQQVFQAITDEVNYFGLSPSYIPFPALDSSLATANAFEALSTVARQRGDLARQREQEALQANVKGKSSAVQFQSDLISLRNNYENQLANLCGTFPAANGVQYPAIRKYAQLHPIAQLLGDPCGRMGSGELNNHMGAVSDTKTRLDQTVLRLDHVTKDIDIERHRANEICRIIDEEGDYLFETAGQMASVQRKMTEAKAYASFAIQSLNALIEGYKVGKCGLNPFECGVDKTAGVLMGAAGVATAGTTLGTELYIAKTERDLADVRAKGIQKNAAWECQKITVDSTARIANLFQDMLEAELEVLRADYAVRIAVATVVHDWGEAQRLQLQQQQAEELSIDLAAAQNDPNVRIYQNDAVVNADVSFRDAIQMAYRLTRVYEYYTSQSYVKKGQLFLIRMVSSGQYNLDNYLLELDNAFRDFEEDFGNPDLRVMALSLRDDVLQIPYIGENGQPLSENDRIHKMQDRLKDVALLDERGYLVLPFSTKLKELSPLTRNHKVHHLEIDLQGGRMGDHVARIYVTMLGTGVVRSVDDDLDFYVFPERTAVVNASILGNKLYDPEVYKSYRFRDRPLINTQWALVINQRDELANRDLDLQSLADVRVLVYYTDFTSF